MFEKLSNRIGDIEMTVSSLKSDSLSSSTSAEEKKRIPPQLSVCCILSRTLTGWCSRKKKTTK